MTRSIRAYRAAARCDDLAANAARSSAAEERQYRETAALWRKIAAEESAKERARRVICWCGREVTPRSLDGINCVEHDSPLSASAPSNPTTPGGVFAAAL
jgi:hypothetical protein